MDAKSKKMLFVGYSLHLKASRFIDPKTYKITTSRDCRFLTRREVWETNPSQYRLIPIFFSVDEQNWWWFHYCKQKGILSWQYHKDTVRIAKQFHAEPCTCNEATASPERDKWMATMKEELWALKTIGNIQSFTKNMDENGNLIRYKAQTYSYVEVHRQTSRAKWTNIASILFNSINHSSLMSYSIAARARCHKRRGKSESSRIGIGFVFLFSGRTIAHSLSRSNW